MTPRDRKLDKFLEAVRKDESLPQGRLDDPEDVAALRAAIELRALREGSDVPSEEFLDEVRRRMIESENAPAAEREVSRRALLRGGIAAAGVAAAGVAGAALDRAVLRPGGPEVAQSELAPDNGEWVPVVASSSLGPGRVHRFVTSGAVGFVSEKDGVPVAVSGACSHLGCLLQANAQGTRLDCPCHNTAFSNDGKVMFSQLPTSPGPLARIRARHRDGNVEVFVPRQEA
jgi:Rieske Fe-S protein